MSATERLVIEGCAVATVDAAGTEHAAGHVVVEQPETSSAASAALAAAASMSTSSRAQMGYSSVSHWNRVPCWASPRVIHWYRWWWQLTSPGVARQPRPSTSRAGPNSSGQGPRPTARMRSPSTTR